MKEVFEEVKIEMIVFDNADVITDSIELPDQDVDI